MTTLSFPFTMNAAPAQATVFGTDVVGISLRSYGIGLTVQFTLAEAREAIQALGKAVAAAEALPAAMPAAEGRA